MILSRNMPQKESQGGADDDLSAYNRILPVFLWFTSGVGVGDWMLEVLYCLNALLCIPCALSYLLSWKKQKL